MHKLGSMATKLIIVVACLVLQSTPSSASLWSIPLAEPAPTIFDLALVKYMNESIERARVRQNEDIDRYNQWAHEINALGPATSCENARRAMPKFEGFIGFLANTIAFTTKAERSDKVAEAIADYDRYAAAGQKYCFADKPSDSPALRGTYYELGLGRAVDLPRAMELYKVACDTGDATGCHSLARGYDQGEGVAHDAAMATRLYRQACDHDVYLSCQFVGLALAQEGASQNYTLAAAAFTKACDHNMLDSCFKLGAMSFQGLGLPQDNSRAIQLLTKSCTGNAPSIEGCYGMGQMMFLGQGVPQNFGRADAFFKIACDGNAAEACYNLGVMNAVGLGVPKDVKNAIYLYHKASRLDPHFDARQQLKDVGGKPCPANPARSGKDTAERVRIGCA